MSAKGGVGAETRVQARRRRPDPQCFRSYSAVEYPLLPLSPSLCTVPGSLLINLGVS